jgi:hypothetical protein
MGVGQAVDNVGSCEQTIRAGRTMYAIEPMLACGLYAGISDRARACSDALADSGRSDPCARSAKALQSSSAGSSRAGGE